MIWARISDGIIVRPWSLRVITNYYWNLHSDLERAHIAYGSSSRKLHSGECWYSCEKMLHIIQLRRLVSIFNSWASLDLALWSCVRVLRIWIQLKIYGALKRQVYRDGRQFSSEDILGGPILDTWRAIITEQIPSLTGSRDKRVTTIIFKDPTYPINYHIYHLSNVKRKLSLIVLLICVHIICK